MYLIKDPVISHCLCELNYLETLYNALVSTLWHIAQSVRDGIIITDLV